MQRFHLERTEDVSGSSGVGTVAEGVIFTDGAAVMCWLIEPRSVTYYRHISDVERIHGHEGRTTVRVLDEP